MGGKPRKSALGELGKAVLPQAPAPVPSPGLARVLGAIKESQGKHLGQTGSLKR